MSSQSDLLERALRHAAAYLDAIRDRRVAATATGDQMRAAMLQPMPDDGVPAEQVLDDLAALAATGTAATQGPRYFGFVIGGSLPVATATDWLVSAWDQNAGVVLNQVLVRVDHGRPDADAVTRDTIARVQADGTCWLSGTTWHGMAAMRIAVSNWSTTIEDMDRSADAILRSIP